ncbi:MAG: RtcB family protein, partial [Planctomycetota bacterium]
MNTRQLTRLGIPRFAVKSAIGAIQALAAEKVYSKAEIKRRVQQVVAEPQLFVGDACLDDFARELQREPLEQAFDPIEYRTWGKDIDTAAHQQMENACRLPSARGAALMPDAHVGYG